MTPFLQHFISSIKNLFSRDTKSSSNDHSPEKPSKKKKDVDPTSLTHVYTPVNNLKLGMYITELDKPWTETTFLFQGFEIKTEKEIQAVKKACSFVYVDMQKSRVIKDDTDSKTTRFEEEILKAGKTYSASGLLIAEFMQNAATGKSVDLLSAKQSVAECVDSVLYFPDTLLWLTQLKNKDEYTAQHCLNVCILSITLGRFLEFPEIKLNELGLCGMMFDIGKSQIPTAILNKEGALTPEEKEIFRTHTTLGYDILKSTNGITLSAMNAALMHHERLDGSGYPNGFKREELSEITRIVAIADMYDALTSNRAQKKSRTHLEAITLMTNAVGTHLDATLVYKFIECLGVYPPGCAVEMINGSIAIVIEVNHQFRLKPKVILILDEEKNFMLNEKPLDLAESPVDKFGEPYIIKSIVRPEDWNINLINYYQQEILEKGLAKMR